MGMNGISGSGHPKPAGRPPQGASPTEATVKAKTGTQISDRKDEAYRVTISVEAEALSKQNIEPISVNVKIGGSSLFSVLSGIKRFINLFIGNNIA